MEIKLNSKEVDAVIKTAKLVSKVTGDELPSAWELMKSIAQENNKLLTVKPDFMTGNVTVNISEEYVSKGMDVFNEYFPCIYTTGLTLFGAYTAMMMDMQELADSFTEREEKE